EADLAGKLRLALWRLDSRTAAFLTREDTRPFAHYSAVFAPPLALDTRQNTWRPGTLVEPSPLLDAHLPPCMLLHFQATAEAGLGAPPGGGGPPGGPAAAGAGRGGPGQRPPRPPATAPGNDPRPARRRAARPRPQARRAHHGARPHPADGLRHPPAGR